MTQESPANTGWLRHSRFGFPDSADTLAAEQWCSAVDELRRQKASPAEYRARWGELFRVDSVARATTAPLWIPDRDALERSNLARWMGERGVNSVEEFHRWTISSSADFWEEAVRRLEIHFRQPAGETVDLSRGVAEAVWFPGARLNIVESCFRGQPEQTAIVSQAPGQPLRFVSYQELERQSMQVAHGARGMGWKAGDRIAVVLPMTAWSVPIYLGLIRAGCAVVSIADSFAQEEIANRLRIADAVAVFTYDHTLRAGKEIALYDRVQASTTLPIVVLAADEGRPRVTIRPQDRTWDDFLSTSGDPFAEIVDAQDCINVLFSSGTTGDPKAIVWNHLTPIKCAVDGYLHQDIRAGDVCVWPTNLGWMMGPWLIFATLINRGTIGIYEDAPLSGEFGRFVQDARVRMLGVVPSIVKAWRTSGCMESWDWSTLHTFSSTGETSHPEDMFYLSSLAGIRPVIEYCGGTEIGGGYISSTVLRPNHASAFNSPAMGMDFLILDAAGQPSDEGELFIASPSVGLSSRLLNRDHHQSYFTDTPSLPDHPVLRKHGDHFQRLPGGLYLAGGRVDDTMNLGGIKISSAELERVCNRVTGVKESAAIAVSVERGPEQLVVFVVREPAGPSEEELARQMNRALRDHLNPLFKVQRVIVVDSLPRTASNKVMRRLLRDRLVSAPR